MLQHVAVQTAQNQSGSVQGSHLLSLLSFDMTGQQHKDCVRLMKTTISCGVLKATENKSTLLFKTKDKSVPKLTLGVNFPFPSLSILLFKVILLSPTKDLVVKVGNEHYSINGITLFCQSTCICH